MSSIETFVKYSRYIDYIVTYAVDTSAVCTSVTSITKKCMFYIPTLVSTSIPIITSITNFCINYIPIHKYVLTMIKISVPIVQVYKNQNSIIKINSVTKIGIYILMIKFGIFIF